MWCNKFSKILNSSILFSICVCAFLYIGLVFVQSADAASKKPQIKDARSITGTVSIIRDNYISIVFKTDSATNEDYEMIFLLDETVTFQRAELSELEEGDTVLISFDEFSEEDDKGAKKFKKRITKNIKFLHKASKSLRSKQ